MEIADLCSRPQVVNGGLFCNSPCLYQAPRARPAPKVTQSAEAVMVRQQDGMHRETDGLSGRQGSKLSNASQKVRLDLCCKMCLNSFPDELGPFGRTDMHAKMSVICATLSEQW